MASCGSGVWLGRCVEFGQLDLGSRLQCTLRTVPYGSQGRGDGAARGTAHISTRMAPCSCRGIPVRARDGHVAIPALHSSGRLRRLTLG